MSEWPFVQAAYGLTWLTLAVYAGWALARQRRARRAIAEQRDSNTVPGGGTL